MATTEMISTHRFGYRSWRDLQVQIGVIGKSYLLLRQLLLLLLLLFHRGHAGLYVGSGLQILTLERNSVRHQLVLSVLSLR
jgi:hypothetical protein